jgi:hypothetical protein
VVSERGLSWFAAANLLLMQRPPGLARLLLEGVEIDATIDVSENGSIGGAGGISGGVACGASFLASGLPPWPSYTLIPHAESGAVVLAQGPTPVYYRRVVSPAGVGPRVSELTVAGPNARDRITYVARLAALKPSALPLQGNERHSVAWNGPTALSSEVERIGVDIRRRYRLLLQHLVAAGVLTGSDAESLPTPPVRVIVRDVRRER